MLFIAFYESVHLQADKCALQKEKTVGFSSNEW